jgi:hypothetical protein
MPVVVLFITENFCAELRYTLDPEGGHVREEPDFGGVNGFNQSNFES